MLFSGSLTAESRDSFELETFREPAFHSRTVCEVLSRWEHAPAKKLFSAAVADLLRPVHPAVLAQTKKMPRVLIRRHSQIVEPEQHHPRCPVRSVQGGLAGQREIGHPLAQPRSKIRPPQELPRVFPVERRNAPLRLQHFARSAVHFPAHIKCQLRFDAHRSSAAQLARIIKPPVEANSASHRPAIGRPRTSCKPPF